MEKRVEILSKSTIFSRFIFQIQEASFRFMKYSGQMSAPVTRLCLERGDSVAALIYIKSLDSIILAEQFRYPTHEKGPGWMLELPAGVVDKNEAPATSVIREVEEEIGYRPRADQVQHIGTFYLSPGGTSERIHLYYTPVTEQDKVSDGGGLSSENENIRQISLSSAQAFDQVNSGQINDAKTLIGLQWLMLHPEARR